MVYEFKFPDLGEGVAEGEIVEWFVKEGDFVKEHQVLGRVETDKAIVEIPSPKSGKILKIHFKPGDTVKVGETIVTIAEEGETVEAKLVPAGAVGYLEEAVEEIKPVTTITKPSEPTVLATPAVRRLARELNVDLTKIKGTGIGGRITEEDVRKASSEKTLQITVKRKYDFYGHIEHIPLKGMRKTIAKHMVESKFTAPHVTHMDEADVTELVKIREEDKKEAEKNGIHLTYLPYIIKALVIALKEHPYLNASLDEENEEIILKKYYNIGIAIDTKDGLIVPVIKGADQKDLFQLAKEIQEFVEKANARSLDLADLKGGTFTITNVGTIGGIWSTPIINYPEVAILATGRIKDMPVVKNGEILIRKILPLSVSFDHRVVDGAEVARFTKRLIELLENPKLFLK